MNIAVIVLFEVNVPLVSDHLSQVVVYPFASCLVAVNVVAVPPLWGIDIVCPLVVNDVPVITLTTLGDGLIVPFVLLTVIVYTLVLTSAAADGVLKFVVSELTDLISTFFSPSDPAKLFQ